MNTPVIPGENIPKNPDFLGVNLFTGSIGYSYMLETPKGTNDLAPQLSLFYDSHDIKTIPSFLGNGWSLSQDYIYRDTNYTFSDTSDDRMKLVFKGKLYDLIFNASEEIYHTKIESYFYIKNMDGGNNSLGNYGILKTKDGTTYRFGFNNDSELVSNLYGYATRWSLDLVNDTYGNSIFYTYNENPYPKDIGSVYPKKIEYNNDKQRKIEFVFESSDRSDLRTVYKEGNKIRQSRRLKKIIISENNGLVRKYILGYQTFEYIPGVSLLHNQKQTYIFGCLFFLSFRFSYH